VWLTVSDVQDILPRLIERVLALVLDSTFSGVRIWG
jgi:hypothetical protein